MTTAIIVDEDKVSRRSFLAAFLLAAAAATVVAVEPSAVEAQERQFTGSPSRASASAPRESVATKVASPRCARPSCSPAAARIRGPGSLTPGAEEVTLSLLLALCRRRGVLEDVSR